MKKLSIQLLSDVILEKRKNRNISQEQLSKLTGINRLMIGRIEKRIYSIHRAASGFSRSFTVRHYNSVRRRTLFQRFFIC